MPITWQMSRKWIDVKFSDPYTISESETVMKEIFGHPGVTRPLRFLVDVRNSAAPNTEFVTSAITFWQLHVDKMWGAKVAIVTGTAVQARMAHVSEMTVESRELPFTLRVFDQSELPQAEQWLELGADATPFQS